MANTRRRPTPWGWIILGFIVFWPIGVLLLLNRLAVDKSATLTASTGSGVLIVSYILMGIGAICLIGALAGESGMFAGAVLFGVGGIYVNRLAKKTKCTGELYKKYIALVINQGQTSIDVIASALNVTYDDAVKDLRGMIEKGYFVGAYIDTNLREIVLTKNAPQHEVATAAHAPSRIVTCCSCGANNRVVGPTGECEYCGSHLQ